jgi:hypothetical protein
MASSKGRRTIRRSLQEVGLGWLLKTTPESLGRKPIPFWKKISTTGYAVLGFLALLIALEQGYPWLSLQKDESLDPSKPYSTMFLVTNTGYFSATDVDVNCKLSFLTPGDNRFIDNTVEFPNSAFELAHGGYFTVPCMDSISIMERTLILRRPLGQRPFSEVSMTILVRYTMFHMPKFKPLHRTFRLKALRTSSGDWRWTFVG